ncbi:hypothetical protein KL942_000845 [Ogataea angusta]|uniref:Uncharacterized protein n=1 Tax=Pichia angusta TaxID=870730 RepID=A0ABQ7S282_PICAN|nr:hypothetical protein KL942_000845 [Ogataea angusta]KAG7852098.1 hypothetical protein KL940_000980 [Ogataea angusta]
MRNTRPAKYIPLFNRFTPRSGETSLHWQIVDDSTYHASSRPAPNGSERVETGSFRLRVAHHAPRDLQRRQEGPDSHVADQQARQADQQFAAQALGQKRDPAAGAAPEARDPALGHAARRPDQGPDAPAARTGNFAGNRPNAAEIGAARRVSGFGARRKAPDSRWRVAAADGQGLCAPVRHADPGPPDRKSAGTGCQGPF